MNRITIIGNLTRDPETGTTSAGNNYCRFIVAVNRRKRKEGEPDADFMRVTAWSSLAENCGKYLTKGKKVAVNGSAYSYGWQRQDGSIGSQIEINALDVEFLSGGKGEGGRGPNDPPEDPAWARPEMDPESGMEISNEEPPF